MTQIASQEDVDKILKHLSSVQHIRIWILGKGLSNALYFELIEQGLNVKCKANQCIYKIIKWVNIMPTW